MISRDGHGLSGMRERAALYRGAVTAGASDHGWVVRARLPIRPPALQPNQKNR